MEDANETNEQVNVNDEMKERDAGDQQHESIARCAWCLSLLVGCLLLCAGVK